MHKSVATTVAWGFRVPAIPLCAQLETYVDCGKAIKAFQESAGSRLPQELVQIIREYLRESVIEERLEWWRDAEKCCAGSCDCEADNTHSEREYMLMGKLGERANNFEFGKCRKIFADDFKLETHFCVYRQMTYEGVEARKVSAFIILPSKFSYLKSSIGGRKYPQGSVTSSHVVDPAMAREPCTEQKALFNAALNTLQIKPKAEVMFSLPTSVRYLPDWPSESWWNRTRKEQEIEDTMLSSCESPQLLVITSGIL